MSIAPSAPKMSTPCASASTPLTFFGTSDLESSNKGNSNESGLGGEEVLTKKIQTLKIRLQVKAKQTHILASCDPGRALARVHLESRVMSTHPVQA